MFSLAEILNLIRLTEADLKRLQAAIDGDDAAASDDASEVIVQMDNLSQKLKRLYMESRPADSQYPTYEEYLETLASLKYAQD